MSISSAQNKELQRIASLANSDSEQNRLTVELTEFTRTADESTQTEFSALVKSAVDDNIKGMEMDRKEWVKLPFAERHGLVFSMPKPLPKPESRFRRYLISLFKW